MSKLNFTAARKLLVILAAGLTVALAGLLVYQANRSDPSTSLARSQQEADSLTKDGDYQQAYDKLKAAEQQASSQAEKVAIYSDLAAAAANAGKLGEALEYYELRHQLEPSTKGQDAYLVAILYERRDDPASALTYYRFALEYQRSQPASETRDAQVESLQVAIDSLETAQ